MAKSLNVNEVRSDFPILDRKVYGLPLAYLDNAATSQTPSSVIQTIVDYYEGYNSNVHRGVHALSMEATDHYERARVKVAEFIGAPRPESIVWTRGTTESINLVAYSWAPENISTGDVIVVSQMEHHSNIVTWQRVATECQAELRIIPLKQDGTLDTSEMEKYLDDRVKLLAICHVSNALGTINPVKQLISQAHAVGAKVLIDGAQSVPHMPVNVMELDCDFLAFSAHKMLGPTGIGALYARPEILDQMEPFMRGGDMVLEVWNDRATWNEVPHKFEAGTPNIAGAIGFGAAVDYLQGLGMDNVRDHEKTIMTYALKRFKEFEELDVYGPSDINIRGGVLSFHSSDVHPHDLGTFLDRAGVAIRTGHHCSMPLMRSMGIMATARASFYIYNTESEVDRLADTVRNALQYFGNGGG